MKFLIKAAFWLSVVVFFLPSPQNAKNANMPGVSTSDAIAFLSSAYSDVKGFCARNPDSCVTGTAAVQSFGVKAEYGAKLLHDFISEKTAQSADLVPPKGSRAIKAEPHQAQINQADEDAVHHGTLNANDLSPQWRGAARKIASSEIMGAN